MGDRAAVRTTIALFAALAVIGLAGSGSRAAPREETCAMPLPPGYATLVGHALQAREDVWGNELLAAPGGPTYEAAASRLPPLLFARAAHSRRLTSSGVHYVPFSGPVGPRGAEVVALHVADGSQILSQHRPRRSLTVTVGRTGGERFGSCLARLATPALAGGYLPILETRYRDAGGANYRQESFATRIAQTGALVSFVSVTVDTRGSGPATVRFTTSESGLVRRGFSLVGSGKTVLAFAPGATVGRASVAYAVPTGRTRTLRVAWLSEPAPARAIPLDAAAFATARSALARAWSSRLERGATIEVPEQRVENAYRALLVQDLALTWRYSVGNQYEEFSYPEGIDVAETLSAQGFASVARSMLLTSLETPTTRYPNWKMGQRLVGSALYYRLFRDRSYVEAATPALRSYVDELGRQIRSSPSGILSRERYSSDIADVVYGLHSQAIVWQGLRSMSAVWLETGSPTLAAEAKTLASRLERGLRAAVRSSQRPLPDGSLFVPARLLEGEKPYDTVTESRSGGYWNLVAPYAFASGLFEPGGAQANGVIRYLLAHGARLLGVVRAGVYSIYGLDAPRPTSGVNAVYGLNVARFLAENDRADQLVLSLYGQLAIAMTRGTFVAGEGVSITPLAGEYYRSAYLPPNGASNGTFLETLRLMLVRERRDRGLAPTGLELAFATPRAWLQPGKRIVVRRAPTSFGPVSFTIAAQRGEVRVVVEAPAHRTPGSLRIRLRLPAGTSMVAVALNGKSYARFDARTQTIDLSGRRGRLALVVRTEER